MEKTAIYYNTYTNEIRETLVISWIYYFAMFMRSRLQMKNNSMHLGKISSWVLNVKLQFIAARTE